MDFLGTCGGPNKPQVDCPKEPRRKFFVYCLSSQPPTTNTFIVLWLFFLNENDYLAVTATTYMVLFCRLKEKIKKNKLGVTGSDILYLNHLHFGVQLLDHRALVQSKVLVIHGRWTLSDSSD